MSSISVPSYLFDPEGFEHPRWCDLGECTAPSALRQRGVDEAAVPLYLRGNHLTTPFVIEAASARAGEADFTVQAWRGVDQPVTNEVEGVDLVAEMTVQNLRIGLPVAVEQLGPLARAFAGLRDTARAGRPLTIVQQAVAALTSFGEFDARVVARILPMWRRWAELTPADVDQVIAFFQIEGEL
jgi:hypothetical protein